MESKLKPCPFCGGEAKIVANCYNQHYICCKKCKCAFWADYTRKEDAVNGWNRRTSDDNDLHTS